MNRNQRNTIRSVTMSAFAIVGGIALLAPATCAQCSWSPLGAGIASPNGTAAPNVLAMVSLPNGQLIAGGQFTQAGGVSANHIARWDGSTWAPLGSGMAGGASTRVSCLLVLPNGDLIAGGEFTMAGGINANRIARWNGSVWQALGTGLQGVVGTGVSALALLPNGGLVAGGQFTTAGGVSAANIARWNGASWSALGPGLTLPALSGTATVMALAVQPNGDVIAGGRFASAGGTNVSNIARWNGASWAPLGAGTNNWVGALTTMANGDVIAGGAFTGPGAGIARWNGATWQPLGSGVGGTFLPFVSSLRTIANGHLLAGGWFTTAGGVGAQAMARWDGTAWHAVDASVTQTALQPPGVVWCHVAGPNGDLVVGGQFAAATGLAVHAVARCRSQGAVVFNELVYDAAASDEFVELFNPTNQFIDISGWQLVAVNPSGQTTVEVVPTSPPIAAGGLRLLGGSSGNPLDAPLPNGATSLRLLDENGALIDTIAYESSDTSSGALPGQLYQGRPLFGAHVYSPMFPTSWSRDLDGHTTFTGGQHQSDNGLEWRIMPATPGSTNNQPNLRDRVVQSYTGMAGTLLPTWYGNLGPPAVVVAPSAPYPASRDGGDYAFFAAPDPAGTPSGRSFMLRTEAFDNFQVDAYVYLDLPTNLPTGGLCAWSIGLCGTTDSNYEFPNPGRAPRADVNGDTGITWTYEVTRTGPGNSVIGRLSLVDNEAGGTNHVVLWSREITNADWYRLGLGVAPGSCNLQFGGMVDDTSPDVERALYRSFGGVYVGVRQSHNVGFGLGLDGWFLYHSWNMLETTGPGCDGNCPPRNNDPKTLDRSVMPPPSMTTRTYAIYLPNSKQFTASQLCFYMAPYRLSPAPDASVQLYTSVLDAEQQPTPGVLIANTTGTLAAEGLDWWVANLAYSGATNVFLMLTVNESLHPPIIDARTNGALPEMVSYRIQNSQGGYGPLLQAGWSFKWTCVDDSSYLRVDSKGSDNDMSTIDQILSGFPVVPTLVVLMLDINAINLPLDFLGLPTCKAYVNPVDLQAFLAVGGSQTASVVIPNALPLLGVSLHAQWAEFNPTYNAFGARTSARRTVTIR